MFSLSSRKFHSAIILPGLLSLLFMGAAKAPDNHPPVAVNDAYTVHRSLSLDGAFLANDSDPDGDPISITTTGWFNGAHGQLFITGSGGFVYNPTFGYLGTDTYGYTVCDNHSACASATVTFTVVNAVPVTTGETYNVHISLSIDGALLANDHDPDNDPISITPGGWTTGAHGQFFVNGSGGFVYNPTFGYVGADTYTYTVCDNWAGCANATVTFNVVNTPPVTAGETYTVHRSLSIDGALLVNDHDPDNDPISISPGGWTTGAHGQFFVNGSGGFVYDPTFGYTGSDSYVYTVCDNWAGCTNATVTFNVVNAAPITVDKSFIVHGSYSKDGALLVGDSDPDGDPISISPGGWTYGPNGSFFVNGSGGFVYDPHSGFFGSDSYTYNVCDNLAKCTNETVTFLVLENNDGANDGPCEDCKGAVGSPINITNGNMYLQQADYALPGMGSGIDVTRTYNSNSQRVGVFGRGWSTMYDESIQIYSATFIRYNAAGGRATYFGRPNASTAFAPIEQDFHGQIVQNGNGSFTLTMNDGSTYQFNSAGQLTSLADRNGNQSTLSYDANGHLVSITDSFGRALTVTPNSNGQALTISDSMGTIAGYSYGGGNELLSVTYADNSAFQFSYDGNHRLTSVTDALGNILESHTYNSAGQAITSERQGGVNHYSLSYLGGETDVTDGLGHVTKYTFDTTRDRNVVTRVEGLCNCGGGGSQVQTWTYDNQLNVTSKTDALGHVTSYTYDGNGNRLTETDATGTVTYTYNGFAKVLTSTDQLNGVTTNTYDGQGNLLTKTDALNSTTTLTYNARGQVLTATDARGKVTTFTYDATGNLTQRKDANNIITFFFYDARSRLTKVRDGLSRSTLYTYDAAGRINKVTYPDLAFVSITYDLAGRRTVVTDERANATNYAFDGAYRLTSSTDAANQTTSYSYDSMSNMTSMTDALSRVTNYDYDDFNRLVKTTYPAATIGATRLFETIAYDGDGNVSTRTDTAGRVTSYAYDSVNRLTSSTDADNKTTGFQYDALGRVTALTDATNQQYQFAYDAVGRQTQATRGGVSMSHIYDAVGNRTQRTDYNGTVTNYAYDNLNRLTTIVYPTRTVTFAYDPLNNLTRATNENGSVYVGYDNRYRVSSFSDPFYYGISYNYDTVGNRTKLKVNGATYATYTYDAVNRLTSLKDGANLNFAYSYDAANRLTSRSAPNGVASSYSYDNLDRLTSLMHMAGATTLSGNLYTYNDANNITSWTTASTQRAFTYDALDRLTGASNFETPTENYSYNAVGNRTASHLSASYSYQPFNKLTSTASATYSYDNNGNLTSRTDSLGTWTFGYDEENRLTQVTIPSGPTVNYKYDGLGRRIQRTTTAGASERYVYDGNDALLDLNADWSVATTYFNGLGIDNHLRQSNSTTGVSYFLTDHLGSTNALTDVNGNVLEQPAYDSFGNSGGSARTRYGYTGRERDPDTGMLYYRARFYDPTLGRFIGEDPVGFQGGINFYAYVKNAPLKFRDPTGLDPWNTWDFLQHYYFGGGQPVDLADVGLLERFQRSGSVTAATTAFKQQVLERAKKEARDQCARNAVTGKDWPGYFRLAPTSVVTDVTHEPGLFVVGHSSFYRHAVGFVYPNCKCRTFRFSATLGFYIRDWFEDPLGVGIEPGGFVYRINASWMEDFSGNGRF
ncbi:MAG TPA: Ig-like domain-containing protein [Pyrinomonadaceae bacterium]|nr:Ig-like domain-containing protein [Pyrinomonadaceae bacterium]